MRWDELAESLGEAMISYFKASQFKSEKFRRLVTTLPCQHCGSEFTPERPLQRVCSAICAARKVKADKKTEAATTKARKEALKRIPDYIKDAQHAFNAFIRLRDRSKPCICCGRTGAGEMHGGEWDAGHYRSRGAAPHLRFDERNVHAQLKQCNRYASGNVVGYRAGLIERIGQEAVDALEADQAPRHYSIEELRAIKAHYTSMARVLKKRAANV